MKVLFTNAVGEMPDYYKLIMRRKLFRWRLPVPAFGLRFIRENVSGVEILEYPSWKEFKQEIGNEDYSVLGISFYQKDIPTVRKMIKYARKEGVEEIWGGNYGILYPDIRDDFDRCFIGYAEDDVSKALGEGGVDRLKHPPLVSEVTTPLIPFYSRKQAFLFTSRGCNMKCSFCQTPSFVPKHRTIPLESIREVLNKYSEMGIESVHIPDENFLMNRSHSDRVIGLLEEMGFKWGCMTKVGLLDGRIENLVDRGLTAVQIGIESLSQSELDWVGKGADAERTVRLIRELGKNDVGVWGTFIIGYPDQTKEDIRDEVARLASFEELKACQIFILTPFPETPLWEKLSEYGPFDPDWSKYDCMHLVWNHPQIGKREMRDLLFESYKKVYSRRKYLKSLLKNLLPFF